MTTIDNNYSPSYIVRQVHEILHLDDSLNPVDNDFNITFSSQWNDYSKSLLPVPIICAALGIIAVVVLSFALCGRICCKCCRCMPEFSHDAKDRARYLGFGAIFFLILVILANQIVLFGNRYLNEGINISQDSVDFLHDLTQTLTNQGNTLLSEGDSLQSHLQQASTTCPPATSLANGVSQYDGYVNDYLDYVKPIPGRCNDANDAIDNWEQNKDSSVWVVYAVFWTVPLLFALGYWCQQKCTVQIGIALSQILNVIVFLLVGTVMVILMGYADYCMAPVDNLYGLLPRDIYNVTSYYLECQGVNPLSGYINDAYEFVDQYEVAINTLLTSTCIGNPYLVDALGDLANINSTLNAVSADLVCPPIQNQLADLVYDGLCTEAFQGIYTIWLGQYLTAACLLTATILLSLLYQYFGENYDEVDNEGEENVGEGRDHVQGNEFSHDDSIYYVSEAEMIPVANPKPSSFEYGSGDNNDNDNRSSVSSGKNYV